MVAVGGRFGDVQNRLYNAAYVRYDASLSYRRKEGDVALNVQTLADEKYIRTTTLYGSPRDFSLRMCYRF